MKKICETYPGKPCIHGHNGRRYVSTGRCVFCMSVTGKQWYKKRKERLSKGADNDRLDQGNRV